MYLLALKTYKMYIIHKIGTDSTYIKHTFWFAWGPRPWPTHRLPQKAEGVLFCSTISHWHQYCGQGKWSYKLCWGRLVHPIPSHSRQQSTRQTPANTINTYKQHNHVIMTVLYCQNGASSLCLIQPTLGSVGLHWMSSTDFVWAE